MDPGPRDRARLDRCTLPDVQNAVGVAPAHNRHERFEGQVPIDGNRLDARTRADTAVSPNVDLAREDAVGAATEISVHDQHVVQDGPGRKVYRRGHADNTLVTLLNDAAAVFGLARQLQPVLQLLPEGLSKKILGADIPPVDFQRLLFPQAERATTPRPKKSTDRWRSG